MQNILNPKHKLRQKFKNTLLEMDPCERTSKSKEACRNLIESPEFKNASVIMMYLALPHEVDTADTCLAAWQSGKIVAVPRVSWQQRHMIPVRIHSLETDMTTNNWGLRNPATNAVPMAFEDIDLVVAPGLGFDKKGNRLGRGASYYDRFLANHQLRACKCGLAFEEQVIDRIPIEEYDVPMDLLVTDKEVVYCNSNSAISGRK